MRESKVLERFLRYVKIDTEADENSSTFPSTEKQKNLGRLLFQELKDMGVEDSFFDEEYGYVYGKIPANDSGKNTKTLAFIAHMDTSPSFCGQNASYPLQGARLPQAWWSYARHNTRS